MHISYKPLWHTLLERDMRKEDLRLAAGMVNLAAVSQLAAGEFWMQSGARVPVPRGREPAARTALKDYLEKQFR